MPPLIGNGIVILLLAALVFFCGRNVLRDIRGQLSGGACSGCSGGCSKCGGCAKCHGSCGSLQK